jgi:hypothetical protein
MTDLQDNTEHDDPVMMRWKFTRDESRIDVYRSSAMSATQIEVAASGSMRTFRFNDRSAVVAFHAGIEHALLETGWQLEGFEPERRVGADRRTLQRGSDRRGMLALVWSR